MIQVYLIKTCTGCWSWTCSPFLCSLQATGAVLAHLTDEKRKHSHVLWVNLHEELVFEGNGKIFTPREPLCLDQPIPVPTSDPQVIEVDREVVLFENLLPLAWDDRSLMWFCFMALIGIRNVPKGGDSACSEEFGGDAGAGETNKDV